MRKPTRATDARAASAQPAQRSGRRDGDPTLPAGRLSRRAFLALLAHPLALELDHDR